MPLPVEVARDGNSRALGEKFRVIALLGQGGMANVYLVLENGPARVRRLAVVKQLRTGIAEDPEFVAMFLDEGRLAARLAHPNIVHTYDVGEYEGTPYLTMEYVEGVSLQALLNLPAKAGAFSVRHVLRVLLDTLSGLQYAHTLRDFDGSPLGVVHRDVSPHNLLVGFDGRVKLADFGIAKAADSSSETRTGVVKGKLRFMSPEQALGDPVDARADLYSVGVILWEALAGERRFKGLTNVVIQQRLTSNEPPASPNGAGRGFPAALDELCVRALAPATRDRFASAEEMSVALTRAAQDLDGGIASNAEVGALVSQLFAADLERRRRLVEAAARLDTAGATPIDDSAPISTSAETRIERDVPAARPAAPPAAPPPEVTLPSPAPAKKPSPLVLLALLAFGLLGAGAMAYAARSRAAAPSVTPAMTVATPELPPPVEPNASAVPRVAAPLIEPLPSVSPESSAARARPKRGSAGERANGSPASRDAEAPTERN